MLKFAKKVISSLIIISLVLMDVASCMEEPQGNAPSSPTIQHKKDPENDSPPHTVNSSSAPARLEGPSPRVVDLSLQQRSASFPVVRYVAAPSASPQIGRTSSADLRLLSVVDSRQISHKGGSEKQQQLSQPLLVVDPDDDESFNALLRHINFLMEGRLTEEQKKGQKKGNFIGVVGSIPNSPIFDTAILALGVARGSSDSAIGFGLTAMLTAMFDSIPRNREFYTSEFLLPEASSRVVIKMPQTEEHQRTFNKVSNFTWVASLLATAPIIKLFVAEEIKRTILNYKDAEYGWLAYCVIYLAVTLIPCMMDNTYFNAIPFLKRVKAYINNWGYQGQRSAHPREEGQRNELMMFCQETARLLTFVSNSERRKFAAGFFSDLDGSEEEKAIKRLKYMVAFHKKHSILKSILDEDNRLNDEKLEWATRTAKGVAGLSFLAQTALFYLILDDLFGSFLGNGILRKISKLFSVLFGSLVGNVVVTANTYGATKNLALKLYGGKNPQEDDSHPWGRSCVTITTMAVGALRALPLTALLTILTNGWSLTPRLLLLTIGAASSNVTNAWGFRWYQNILSAAAWGCKTLGSKLDVVKRTYNTLADSIFLDLNHDHVTKAHKVITQEPDRGSPILALPAPQSVIVSSASSSEASEPHQKKVQEDENKHNGDEDMKQSLVSNSNASASLAPTPLLQQVHSDEVDEHEDDSATLRLAATKKSAPLSTSRMVTSFGIMLAFLVMWGWSLYWQIIPRVDNYLLGSPTNSTGNFTGNSTGFF